MKAIFLTINQLCLFLVTLFMVSACSSSHQPVANIVIVEQGQNLSERPEMDEVCKGFHVNENDMQRFIKYSSTTHEHDSSLTSMLPCYSAGTVLLDGQAFQWQLHLGGIAEFHNEQQSFTKVCGIKCCDKIKGIC